MNISNRSITVIAPLVGLLTLLFCGPADATDLAGAPEQPNIILIVADDLGYGDLGSYGQLKVRTPVLDQLATEGTRFTDFYAGSTVCAPSRASLLTGLHSGHSPVRENPRWTSSGHPVDFGSADRLFSEVLQDAGYSTAIIGKWGMAEDKRVKDLATNPAMPLQQGFDYFFGYKHHGDAHHYYWHELYENNDIFLLEGNDYETNSGQYTHDLFTQKALEYIEGQQANKPFLLYLAYTIPHMAITVPEDSKQPYLGLGWPERKMNTQGHYKHDPEGHTAFAGMVSRMDRDIGRIKALLEEKGIAENTLILFTSDNGHEYDEGFFDSNGPLRGMKRDLYEGGIRVPMIAWWPGTVPANTVSSHLGAFWDVLPTFCELARLQACPDSDGVSFLPTLLGNEKDQQQHEFLYWEFNESQGPIQAVRSGDWKLVRFLGEPPELYDLATDISEQHDVAQKHPDIVRQLTTLLESARVEHPEFPLEWHPRVRPKSANYVYTITEKPTAYQEADRLGIWFPASDFDPLGLYLSPGQPIEIDVKNIKGSTQPRLLVGTYSRYKRDDVPTVYQLTAGSNTVTDPKGGLLYLQFVTEDVPSGEVEVSVAGGSPIPSYVLGETTHEDWLEQLNTMTYENVQFISNRTMVIVSTATALKYKDENQDSMLTTLDRISDIADYISGIDDTSDLHKPNVHKILITELTEKDLDFGLAAEEHRILVPTNALKNIMDPAHASSAAWGLWHEMGHHHQALNWDWNEVDEVTVNIYSLACLYAFDGTIAWLKGHPIWDVLAEYFKSPVEERNFNADKTLGGKGRLAMFRQLWLAFGDEFYMKLHQLAREDNAKPDPRINARDMDTENQMTNFMVFSSQASGYDLTNFFREWGFVLPREDYDALSALKLPDPEIDLISLRE